MISPDISNIATTSVMAHGLPKMHGGLELEAAQLSWHAISPESNKQVKRLSSTIPRKKYIQYVSPRVTARTIYLAAFPARRHMILLFPFLVQWNPLPGNINHQVPGDLLLAETHNAAQVTY